VTTGPSLDDIFTEPTVDPNTLANLGPLAPLAGIWEGTQGQDINPKADGPEFKAFYERFDLQPIDPQTNGPQLLYGLRYQERMTEPGLIGTFHDQVGYLLWEPATGMVIMTLAIPRGQVAMASGTASADARKFTLRATAGDPHFGISTSTFLDEAFHTPSWEITFRIGSDDTWSYEQLTMLEVHGQGPFEHRDSNTLTRVEAPTPNALASA
jgi:hypothetical protein